MSSQHRGPLVAFMVVAALCCVVLLAVKDPAASTSAVVRAIDIIRPHSLGATAPQQFEVVDGAVLAPAPPEPVQPSTPAPHRVRHAAKHPRAAHKASGHRAPTKTNQGPHKKKTRHQGASHKSHHKTRHQVAPAPQRPPWAGHGGLHGSGHAWGRSTSSGVGARLVQSSGATSTPAAAPNGPQPPSGFTGAGPAPSSFGVGHRYGGDGGQRYAPGLTHRFGGDDGHRSAPAPGHRFGGERGQRYAPGLTHRFGGDGGHRYGPGLAHRFGGGPARHDGFGPGYPHGWDHRRGGRG